ncbi:HEAT repeat domain-containing protein [Flavobacterium sp. UMI-01]|uniref:HEAT repeat domain-containing protein n=1 Tax=Flavobacterium sp. UMI-01 TaxID=1441053 RepID=UPI001C7D3B79|nr:hypothetical protein [Flavobacterium sp. UMI-01]GIZ07594.1 hypothetical protein FUMI01_03210 [Flavobacterium sp. UMI-01]
MVNTYQHLVDYLSHAPSIIQISWATSGAFIVTIAVLIVYLKHLRTRLRNKERIIRTYQKKYEADLIEYLYSGDDSGTITAEQQKIITYLHKCSTSALGSGLKRKIIIDTLLKLRNEISGETADAIQQLYYETGFITQASTKLKSKRWDVVARAIRELGAFGIKEVHDEIILYLNHPKQEVRREIQFYLVKLFNFEGLHFLDNYDKKLSEWDQIQLLEILQKSGNQKLPDISNWLQSSNDSVISFALKLAKIYNQFEAQEEIIALLHHPIVAIRIQATEIVSHLGIFEAVAVLKDCISERSLEEQIAFFKIDESLLMTVDADFMMAFIQHENFEIRMSAKNIIKLIDIQIANSIVVQPIKNDNLEDERLTKAS